MKPLSKSSYMTGLQCLKYLWIKFNKPELIPETTETEQFRFDEGHAVGELSKQRFTQGIDIPTEDFNANLEQTQQSLDKDRPLFEAGILVNDLYSRADILVPVKGGWDVIEVKSSTKVKKEHVHDLSFQKYVYERAGLKIKKCFLMHINKEFVKDGDIDVKKFFVKRDITEEVKEASYDIEKRIKEMLKIIKGSKPKVPIGTHCSNPYQCPIKECWSKLPKENVFDLYRGGRKSETLYNDKILAIKDIPADFKLTAKQQIQREVAISGKVHFDKDKIKEFLGTLKYPLYYLDFETFSTAIPIYDRTSPYQQIPFQFSLHVDDGGKKLKHYSFLASSSSDPRYDFVNELRKVLDPVGSIIVYNKSFELKILWQLAERFSKYKIWVKSVERRVIDFLLPFRSFWYYNALQKGSASIKAVLPALTGEEHYSKLSISDGGSASLAFLSMYHKPGMNKLEIRRTRKELLRYCQLDTFAMKVVQGELGK